MTKAKEEIARARTQAAKAEAEAAKTRKTMMIQAARAEAAAKAERAAQARAVAAEAAMKAQAEAAAKTERAAREAAAAKASAEAAEARAKAEAQAEAKAAARRAAVLEAAQAARVKAASDALQTAKREQAARVEAAAAALAAAKAQQAKAGAGAHTSTEAEAEPSGTTMPPSRKAGRTSEGSAGSSTLSAREGTVRHRRAATARPTMRLVPARARIAIVQPRHVFAGRLSTRPRTTPQANASAVARETDAPGPFGTVMVPVQVPGLGLQRPLQWPVFPRDVPAFRAAINHPVVPGFTKTP